MSLKNLFNEEEPINIIPQQSMMSASKEVESVDYIFEFNEDKNRYIPYVDYSDPANFAFFGSAEEYYSKSITYIRDDYPYDGSLKEQLEWRNNATFLDLHLFDKEYPRTNGFIKLSKDGYGAQSTSVAHKNGSLQLVAPVNQEYILFKGGPNVNNIYDTAKNREENLKLDLSGSGVTVEFWANVKNQLAASSSGGTDSYVLFDLWNGQTTGRNDYGRFTIGVNNNASGSNSWWFVHVTSGSTGAHYNSGTAGFFDDWTQSDVEGTGWHHYAFTAQNTGSNLRFELYVDGQQLQTSTISSQAVGPITGSMIATLGAAVAFPDWTTGTPGTVASPSGRGYGKFSGSIDEFRFWKTKRTPKQIGRYYRSQVGGGTNSDDANTSLGVYYKFNEGIVGNTIDDAIVLDYSGRVSNGTWVGYASGSRVTSSAIVLAGAATYEFLDPIVKSGHPSVVSLLASKIESGSIHDMTNNTMLYHNYSNAIIDQDENSEGHLKILCQVMGSYFDTLYLQIENLNNLKTKNYISSSYKPMPHNNKLLTSVGFVAPNIFVDASTLEQFGKRSEKVLFEEHLYNIKNTIYQNIYNNIDYIYKSKGTEKSFRNLLRCYGVDDELIKFNLYANNVTHDLKTNYETVNVKKNYADFNDPDRNAALIYTSQSLAGTAAGTVYSQTTECEVIFPRPRVSQDPSYYWYPHVSSSLFGALASGSNTSGSFGVYAVRNEYESKDVKFVLSSSFGYLTSSVYRDVYDNQQWNFAVRVKPEKPKADLISFGNDDFLLEFSGLNAIAGIVINEFTVSTPIENLYVDDVLATSKRFYVGASRSTISGGINQRSDVKIGSLRHWYSDITNKELFEHAKNPYNLGSERPLTNVGQTLTQINNLEKFNTLAVAWDFQSASTPDSLGLMSVADFSSGSLSAQSLYGTLGSVIKKKYDGVGRFYSANDTSSIDIDYVSILKQRLPESLNSFDMIEIGEDQDQIFTRSSRPVDYFWSFEKSMAQNISDEILNFFATINEFNNLIGEPVHRYRPEYKSLQKFRQLFFQRFQNEIDFERYLNFYKWVDGSINMMLEKLIPLSSNTSGQVRNIVESHVLERNKVWTKFPLTEFKRKEPEGSIQGINQLLYNWQLGSAPLGGLSEDDQHLFWWFSRAERDKILTSGDSLLDASKELLRQVVGTSTTGSHVKLYDLRTSSTYNGQTYALKNAKPYRITVDSDHQKIVDPLLIDSALNVDGTSFTSSIANIGYKQEIDQESLPDFKKKRKRTDLKINEINEGVSMNSFFPFIVQSSSVNTGYQSGLTFEITRIHDDTYNNLSEPLQGPFTEKFVGGHPSRHEEIGTTPGLSRPERYKFNIRTTFQVYKDQISSEIPVARWYRDGLTKRPVNVANIKFTTSSVNQIGNHQNDYEVIQTTGRAANNLWFKKADGVLSSSAQESTIVSGALDFALPNRGVNKSVFVSRFSAPGEAATLSRGYLDVESEEYSAYNQMNYRNSTVRIPLNELLVRHCNQFGIDSVAGSPNASYHKIYRNSLTRIELSGTTAISASTYDNWFVQHQIPRSDRQYSWITGSMLSWSPNGITDTN